MGRPDKNNGNDRIVACPVAVIAQTDPGRPAIFVGDEVVSYSRLDHRISREQLRLTDLGIDPGDRVGFEVPDPVVATIQLWALFRIGAAAVPVGRHVPVALIDELLARVRCDHHLDTYPGRDDQLTLPAAMVPALDLDRPGTVLFTSGSTGPPKATLHTLGNHWSSALGSQSFIPVDKNTRWLCILPMNHVAGMSILFRCFLHGGSVVFPESEKSEIENVLGDTTTHVSVVPTQLGRFMDRIPAARLQSLSIILVGGAPVSSQLLQRAMAMNLPVRTTYGCTEMASQIATATSSSRAELETSGRILPHCAARISGVGEIEVRGKSRFSGYLVGRDLVQPFLDKGWFRTGDLGSFDDDGRLTVTGRMDNMFVSGGENIYPEEIERAILSAGLAEEVIVVATADAEFGERPVAFVNRVPDKDKADAGLTPRIERFKFPVAYVLFPAGDTQPKRSRKQLTKIARSIGEH